MPMLLCVTTNVPASVLDQLRRFNTNLKNSNISMTKRVMTRSPSIVEISKIK